jgi:hypothetical protein
MTSLQAVTLTGLSAWPRTRWPIGLPPIGSDHLSEVGDLRRCARPDCSACADVFAVRPKGWLLAGEVRFVLACSFSLIYSPSAISFHAVPSFAVDQAFCLSSTRSRSRNNLHSHILRGSNIHLCGRDAAKLEIAFIITIIRIFTGR